MSLPASFAFSQASLQDYVDCPRRFQLRYVERLAWPTPVAEPMLEVEAHLARGLDFHRLVYQHALGLDPATIGESISDAKLAMWWEAYLSHPLELPGRRFPEIGVSTSLGGHRLVAQFDLVAAAPGERLVIVDWKTNEGRRPRREWLAKRLQTRVYRYVLAQAGQRFNQGEPVDPSWVEMIYWFAAFPAQPERFGYDPAELEQDRGDLEALVGEIEAAVAQAGSGAAGLAQARGDATCRYCRYASYCEREAGAATADDLEGQADEGAPGAGFDLGLEQVAEVEF